MFILEPITKAWGGGFLLGQGWVTSLSLKLGVEWVDFTLTGGGEVVPSGK